MRLPRSIAAGIAAPLVVLVLLGAPGAAEAKAVRPLPVGTQFDYQLGGTRPVPSTAGIVERDRTARPLAGRYNICYVNGFQTQASQKPFWRKHMRLVLQRRGDPVVDSAWGEWLLDIGTASKRRRLAAIVGRWTRGCARHGFDAVEFDNLDSFTRSHGLLSRADAKRFARVLVRRAHRAGLAAAQKNLAGFDGRKVGYDFVVAEECGRYDECDRYVRHFGRRVLVVEYRTRNFLADCRSYANTIPIVLRDRELSADGVRRWCA